MLENSISDLSHAHVNSACAYSLLVFLQFTYAVYSVLAASLRLYQFSFNPSEDAAKCASVQYS